MLSESPEAKTYSATTEARKHKSSTAKKAANMNMSSGRSPKFDRESVEKYLSDLKRERRLHIAFLSTVPHDDSDTNRTQLRHVQTLIMSVEQALSEEGFEESGIRNSDKK